jgi:hypothetical protein
MSYPQVQHDSQQLHIQSSQLQTHVSEVQTTVSVSANGFRASANGRGTALEASGFMCLRRLFAFAVVGPQRRPALVRSAADAVRGGSVWFALGGLPKTPANAKTRSHDARTALSMQPRRAGRSFWHASCSKAVQAPHRGSTFGSKVRFEGSSLVGTVKSKPRPNWTLRRKKAPNGNLRRPTPYSPIRAPHTH